MAYPRLLNLDEDVLQSLKTYLNDAITNHMSERGAFDDELMNMQADYWADPGPEENDFPFKGAAKIIIPLSAIAFESVHASNMGTIYGLQQFLNIKARKGDMMDYAKAFEDYANYDLEHNVHFRDKSESSIIELEKFGTGFGKARYEELIRYGVRTVDGVEMDFPVTYRRGATVDTVSISRFIMPFTSLHPQEAPWCGESHSAPYSEIVKLTESLFFYKETDDILKGYYMAQASQASDFQRNQQELENTQPILPEQIEWYEIWLAFDVDKSGVPKEICVHYHFDSESFMAIRYNDYSDLRRPYRFGRYFRVENRLYGIGICKQNEQFQAEITIQHRQRLDNATIANIRMFKLQKNSGYGPKEPIFPGKMWFLDDLKDIESFQAGEIYPSAYNNEQQSLVYSQQRTGVNELTLGMPQSGTPGTASDSLARLEESKKKSDYVMNNIKRYLNELVVDVYDVQQQYGPRYNKYYDVVENGHLVQQVLAMPSEYIRDCLMFEIKIVGEQTNKIIDRQNWTQVSGMMTQYFTQMIGLTQQLGKPEITNMMAMKALTAGTEIAKQMLESFDLKNIERILPVELLKIGGEQNVGAIINGGGNTGVEGINETGPVGAPKVASEAPASLLPSPVI